MKNWSLREKLQSLFQKLTTYAKNVDSQYREYPVHVNVRENGGSVIATFVKIAEKIL